MATRQYFKVPDFQYSGDYYPQLAARLRRYGRINAPEITNEDQHEPFIQMESAFALMGHYNNVLLDMVANSLFLRTSTLPESVQLLLELINYRLFPASPARVDVLAKLVQSFSSDTRVLEAYRKFATERTPDVPEIIFENSTTVDIERTDQIGYAYGLQYLKDGTGDLSSVATDIIYDSSAPFVAADLNRVMSISDSVLGNNIEDLRIVELLDVSGVNYRKARLKNASFVSESDVTWTIRDFSTNGEAGLNAGTPTDLFANALTNGDKIYIGHSSVMWDRMDVTIDSVTPGPGWTAVWEFYDPLATTILPDSVDTTISGEITFELTTLLGPDNAAGALVEVSYIPTGVMYRGYSTWDGVNDINVLTIVGYLGQIVPSTKERDYLVSARWRPLTVTTDETIDGGSTWGLVGTGKIEFEIPQTRDNCWIKFLIYDADEGVENSAYFLRMRIVEDAGANGPVPSRVRIDQGSLYVLFQTIQGITVEDSPLGSSSGEASQEFFLTRTPIILGSARIFVDEGGSEYEWIVLDSLVRSMSTDRHCVIETLSDGRGLVKFGDGVNGRIPPIGTNNIRAIYRIDADQDGNIGAETLTVNRDNVGIFQTVTNPRQGKYWVSADWESEEALERAKMRGPLALRTMYRAVSPKDVETLALMFVNQNRVRPVRRAQAYEEAFGPKTIELVVAGSGGAALTDDEKRELEEYFNGGEEWGYPGILLLNSQVTVTNYAPKSIPLQVRVEAFPTVTEGLVLQLLASLVSPTARSSNQIDYVWRFGQTVPLSRIQAEVFKLSPGNVFDVDVTSPSADISLTSRELPLLDVVNTQVVIVPPSFV